MFGTQVWNRYLPNKHSTYNRTPTFVIIIIIIIITTIIIIIIICIIVSCPDTSLESAVIPTAQASSFTLQYFPYYVCCSKYRCLL
jgi:hypothetical protein